MSERSAAAGDREPAGLAELNAMPAGAARPALTACCASAAWVSAVLAGRPYESAARLLRQSDEAVARLGPEDLREALAGHPRIGERTGEAGQGGWSRAEQAGMAGAAERTRQALADGNEAYERRFGHIYLVCATGRSADELLALLRARLANDGGTEWLVVRSELKKINRIRLQKLVGAAG
jgi:2-oxo-4-hydroxy-4-carboxy-5-ureidoimidazoline decarboxylase